ncbi:384_t:CDS:2, partial [Acaulospora colombiana]
SDQEDHSSDSRNIRHEGDPCFNEESLTGNLRNMYIPVVMLMTLKRPWGIFSRVVCITLNPKSLMINEYWTPIPPTKLARQAKSMNIHAFGSLRASMNL